MSRPEDIGGMYRIEPSKLGLKIANGLEQQGEVFLTSNELLEGFGMAYTGKTTHTAIDSLLSFVKYLQAHQARARDIGFIELDRSRLLYAFTYTVESAKHDNQPLWIKEAFILRVPLLALVHELADLWVMAYERRPQKDIVAVLEGC
ncbi:hypothetical protein [Roseateles sp. PN1]|uniref:hypothetical protein n=1 Tax=Roseateles sp. PN1 TaxID=3137372 RepID=UPI003139EEDD